MAFSLQVRGLAASCTCLFRSSVALSESKRFIRVLTDNFVRVILQTACIVGSAVEILVSKKQEPLSTKRRMVGDPETGA